MRQEYKNRVLVRLRCSKVAGCAKAFKCKQRHTCAKMAAVVGCVHLSVCCWSRSWVLWDETYRRIDVLVRVLRQIKPQSHWQFAKGHVGKGSQVKWNRSGISYFFCPSSRSTSFGGNPSLIFTLGASSTQWSMVVVVSSERCQDKKKTDLRKLSWSLAPNKQGDGSTPQL